MKIVNVEPPVGADYSYKLGSLLQVSFIVDITIHQSAYVMLKLLRAPLKGEMRRAKKLFQEHVTFFTYCNVWKNNAREIKFALFFGYTPIYDNDGVVCLERTV